MSDALDAFQEHGKAIISPRREEIRNLPDRLNDGEWRVLEALEQLDEKWRIYVQPTLLMDHPDFVVVHERFGVCAIEVKSWTRGLYRQDDDGTIHVRDARGWQRTGEAPRLQAHRYRSTIFECQPCVHRGGWRRKAPTQASLLGRNGWRQGLYRP